MIRKRIRNILLKEWEVMFTDLNSTLLVTLLPLLIVAQGTLYIWLGVRFAGETALASPFLESALAKLQQALPAVAGLSRPEQFHVLLLNQFNFFLLLVPTMIAISFATFSIVDEKLTGSLEALLATPVRTWELLLGKSLAGAIPALIVTWVCAGVFLIGVSGLGWGNLIGFIVTPSWFLSLLLLTPAIALLSFILGVIGSSRAKDSKSAQNMVVVIILPVLALIVLQVTGIILFTPLLTLALALVLGAVDILALRAAVRLFQRETIVVSWR